MKIFVSSQSVDKSFVHYLIDKLRSEGFVVFHSPRNPLDGEDLRWRDWYRKGFEEELSQAEIFIAVIDYGWDSSTWMYHEIDIATHRYLANGKLKEVYFWNPENINVTALGMIGYLKNKLPLDLDKLLKVLR